MEDAVQKIKDSLKLSQVVSSFKIKVNPIGQNRFNALCPFHHEKTPSFTIDDSKGVFYCFGCQTGGDIISFVAKMKSLTFNDTIRYIYETFNLGPVPNLNVDPSKEKVLALNEEIAKYYHQQLLSDKGKSVLEYLMKKRNLTLETINTFGIGVALREERDSEFYNIIRKADKENVDKSNLLNDRKMPYFYDRIIIPLKDSFGRVIGFSGRALNSETSKIKYLNSKESFIFHKRRMLYNFNAASEFIRSSKEVILVEGYFDVMGLWQNGFKNVVCSMGTSLTEEQTLLLHDANTVNICYDGDLGGETGTQLGIKKLVEKSYNVKTAILPSGDPDEYVYANGADAFKKLLAEAPSYEQYVYSGLKKNGDFSSLASKKRWLLDVFSFAKEVDNVFFTDFVISDLQSFLKINAELLVKAWEDFLITGEIKLEEKPSERDEYAEIQNKRREYFIQAYLYKVGEDIIHANEDVFEGTDYEETYRQLKFQKSKNPERQFVFAMLGDNERNIVTRLILEMPADITRDELSTAMSEFRQTEKEKLEVQGLKEKLKNKNISNNQ
jgi:DNA primase